MQGVGLQSPLASDPPHQAVHALDMLGSPEKRARRGRGLAEGRRGLGVLLKRHEVDGFRAAFAGAAERWDAGDPAGAGRCFVDYWAGEGAWDGMPEPRQGQVAISMGNLRNWYRACMSDLTPLRAFSWMGAPVLLMTGRSSPASSRDFAILTPPPLPRPPA